MSKKVGSTELTFEQAMSQLEEIIRRIESGEVGLEQSIAEYERGVALVKRCEAVLGQAEQRVKEVGKELLASRGRAESAGRADSADEDEPMADEED
jgi:exodeoxyribonuclease VII small subunit